MAQIISLQDKIAQEKEKENELFRQRKIQAVGQILQCTRCGLKCEKCGTHLDGETMPEESESDLRVPYRFCNGCRDEYVDYIQRLQGRGDPRCFWHDQRWLTAWAKWIDYRGALDHYMQSKPFKRLLAELRASPE